MGGGMKILRIILDSDPRSGGPIEGTRRFGAVWARHGHRQDLLTLDAPGEVHLSDYPGEIFAVGGPRTGNLLHRYRYSPRMVPWLHENARNYDAVLVSGLWRYMVMGAKQALTGSKTPYFVLPHGMLDPWFRRTYPLKHCGKQLSWLLAEGPLISGARNVLFTSEEEMYLARNAFWPYRANGLVINYGTQDVAGDPDDQVRVFRTHVPALGDRKYLLFLSRIHPKKGCDLLLDAFGRVATRYPDLDLVVAGPDQVGLVEAFAQQARRAGVEGRVHFPGMLKGDLKIGAFRGAQAFVLPSHQENFGIVVAEAMACGKPVLISDKVNIWREVEADGAGLVRPDTLDGTLSLLSDFLAMPEDQQDAMGARARASFLERFHVDKAAMNLLDVIRSRI